MHASEHQPAAQAAVFDFPDENEREEKRQRQQHASGARQAAYEKLKLGDREQRALEWACSRRGNPAFADLRVLFDGAESQHTDEQLAAWLAGPAFDAGSAETIRAATATAVAEHEKFERSVRFADRAEKGIIWFLQLSIAAMVLVVIAVLLFR